MFDYDYTTITPTKTRTYTWKLPGQLNKRVQVSVCGLTNMRVINTCSKKVQKNLKKVHKYKIKFAICSNINTMFPRYKFVI